MENPVLQQTILEVVENQLRDGNPPGVSQTWVVSSCGLAALYAGRIEVAIAEGASSVKTRPKSTPNSTLEGH